MNRHPYLRAYMAGIAIPTALLMAVITTYTTIRYTCGIPVPIEKIIVFPMAAVPNAWGLWNLMYVAFLQKRHVPLGLFGGILPLLLAPGGYLVAWLLNFTVPREVLHFAPFALPIVLIIYYLAWKYFVGFLNAELGIA